MNQAIATPRFWEKIPMTQKHPVAAAMAFGLLAVVCKYLSPRGAIVSFRDVGFNAIRLHRGTVCDLVFLSRWELPLTSGP